MSPRLRRIAGLAGQSQRSCKSVVNAGADDNGKDGNDDAGAKTQRLHAQVKILQAALALTNQELGETKQKLCKAGNQAALDHANNKSLIDNKDLLGNQTERLHADKEVHLKAQVSEMGGKITETQIKSISVVVRRGLADDRSLFALSLVRPRGLGSLGLGLGGRRGSRGLWLLGQRGS